MFGFNDSYFLFMNEAEGTGMVDTRLGCINTLVNKMKEYPRYYVEENFDDLCMECGLEYLTPEEEDIIWERYSRE